MTDTCEAISIIIPVHKFVPAVESLLADIVSQSLDSDIIIVSPHTQHCQEFSPQITQHVRRLNAPQGRGPQIDAGLRAAKSSTVWILHADSQIPKGAGQVIRDTLSKPGAIMGCFSLKFDVRHWLLRIYSWCSQYDSFFTTFGDQGYFFRRADYTKIIGIAEFQLLEDVELRRQLLALGRGRCVKVDLAITTSARRFLRQGMLRVQWENFLTLLRFKCGTDPSILYHQYYKSETDAPQFPSETAS